jgi:hypothetical protein
MKANERYRLRQELTTDDLISELSGRKGVTKLQNPYGDLICNSHSDQHVAHVCGALALIVEYPEKARDSDVTDVEVKNEMTSMSVTTLLEMIVTGARMVYADYIADHHNLPIELVGQYAMQISELLSPLHQCTDDDFDAIVRIVWSRLDYRKGDRESARYRSD